MRQVFKACLLLAVSIDASAGCKEILSKFPTHSPESSVFAKQVDDYIKNCKNRPEATDPDKLRNCIIVGMRSLGVAGNYVAAERMAIEECDQGNEEISKNWLGLIINNNNASEAERAIANEVINGPQPN